jgi:hypothetical protein
MKIRSKFVSNSSSASFIIPKNELTKKQYEAVKELSKESFYIGETEKFIIGETFMDNLGVKEYFKKIKLQPYTYHVEDHIGWIPLTFIEEVINMNNRK